MVSAFNNNNPAPLWIVIWPVDVFVSGATTPKVPKTVIVPALLDAPFIAKPAPIFNMAPAALVRVFVPDLTEADIVTVP